MVLHSTWQIILHSSNWNKLLKMYEIDIISELYEDPYILMIKV